MITHNTIHTSYMAQALDLARSGLGRVWPNPAVGCLVVRDGAIIAQGATQKGGRPHAEVVALDLAGEHAADATLYVTLEPCSHHGQTPPCTDRIIQSGISRVFVACQDPNPAVNGKGIAALKAAGIEVIEDVLREEAERVNEGFFSLIQRGRPKVICKVATSLDGKMALMSGESKWITGDEARAYGNRLRAYTDAIITGVGTVLADDPELTCRLPDTQERSPVRIVLDRRLELPLESKLVQSAKTVPLWLITSQAVFLVPALQEKLARLQQLGVEIITHDVSQLEAGGEPLTDAMKILAQRGITRLLAEAGPTLTTRLLKAGLADELYWFTAPCLIGMSGKSAIGELNLHSLQEALRFTPVHSEHLGEDRLDIYHSKSQNMHNNPLH